MQEHYLIYWRKWCLYLCWRR